MARDREQPPREVLHADHRRPHAAQARDPRLGGPDHRHRQDSSRVHGRIVTTMLRRIVAGFLALFTRSRMERTLDEELRAYLEASIEDKMRTGMPRQAAVRSARVELGSVDAVKDRTRDVGWETHVENLWRDVWYAGRTL